ncbi:MAG: MBL fold metallo-hydrolase [Pseudomonadota bacterium]|nr:MBL fold metallo-hydrolase [Pseudomonadota bacterium]MEE3101907.1 MBL fold metallo-hydrolase [Pseudomonadota bacterium]
MTHVDLGGTTVDRIVELDPHWIDPFYLFKNIDQPTLDRCADWLGPMLWSPQLNRLAISYHSFLIRAGGRNILVDACNGNDKDRFGMPWTHRFKYTRYLSDLARHGLTPDDIDVVTCTHLHCDHVGWNTRLEDGRWVPTFPNARYVFSREEFEHHRRRFDAWPVDGGPYGYGSFQDSVLPVVEAGLADFVANDHVLRRELDEHVRLEPAPGHTPGHVFVSVKGREGAALITGDAIYHPIQLREPWIAGVGDFDEETAVRTRRAMLDRLSDGDEIALTCHFPDPNACRIRRDGDRYGFDFIYP